MVTLLTGVDEKLIGDARVVHVVDSACKESRQDFQICEHSLGRSGASGPRVALSPAPTYCPQQGLVPPGQG